MSHAMTLLIDNAAIAQFCADMASEKFVCVDTEFMRESTYYAQLCLIQVASPTQAAMIDPLAEGVDLSPFAALLANPDVIKVFHAARQDIEIFVHMFGDAPKNVFDTQIAAQALGYGEQVAYDALMRGVLKVHIDKTSRFTDWSRRPLSEQQLSYALADVTHLAAAYPKLHDRLAKKGRIEWLAEDLAALVDADSYRTHPDDAWQRLKLRKYSAPYLAAFKTVAAWRERVAQARDLPRGRVLKDDGIEDIANAGAKTAEAFERLRAVPKGFAGSKWGQELIAELQVVLADPEAHAPKVARKPNGPGVSPAVLDLLRLMLKLRAEEAGVAPRLIASSADIERIATDKSAAHLTPWKYALFGRDAERALRGEVGFKLAGEAVALVELVP
jgi:ribonuclease D